MPVKSFLTSEESERRLRPALAALSANNPRQALRLSSKHLPHPSAAAVRALALLRLSRQQDAEILVEETWATAKNGALMNSDAVYKISMFWREVGRLDNVAEVFSKGWEAGGATDMGEMAFIALLATEDWGDAGRVATRLHKTVGERALWSALAVYLNAVVGEGGIKMVGLSAAMISRWIKERSDIEVDEARFCVRVLNEDKKGRTARHVLRLCKRMGRVDWMLANASAWEADGSKKEARDAYTNLIREDCDDWDSWLRWMNLHDTLDEALEEGGFLRTLLRSKQSVNGEETTAEKSAFDAPSATHMQQSRGIYLAELETLRRLKRFDTVYDRCVQYFEKFCSHPICAEDLRPYVLCIQSSCSSQQSLDLLSKFATLCPRDSQQATSTLHFLYMWASETLDTKHPFAQQELSLGQILYHARRQRDRNRDLGGARGQQISFANHVKAILVLENGLKRYPGNTLITLALRDSYARIGAVGPCLRMYQLLQVRNIQLVSLGHLLLAPLSSTYWTAKEVDKVLLNPIFILQKQQWSDYWNALPHALQNGNMNVAADLVLFQRRLARSDIFTKAKLQQHALMVSDILSQFAENSKRTHSPVLYTAERDLNHLDSTIDVLVDNRDVGLMDFWNEDVDSIGTRREQLDLGDFGREVQGTTLAECERKVLRHKTACLSVIVAGWHKKSKESGYRKGDSSGGKRGNSLNKIVRGEEQTPLNSEDMRNIAQGFLLQDRLITNSCMYYLCQVLTRPDDGKAASECVDYLEQKVRAIRTNGAFEKEEEQTGSRPRRALCINGCYLGTIGAFVHEDIEWGVAVLCVTDHKLTQIHNVMRKCISKVRAMLEDATGLPLDNMSLHDSVPNGLEHEGRPKSKFSGTKDDAQNNQAVISKIVESYEKSRYQLLQTLKTAEKCLKSIQ